MERRNTIQKELVLRAIETLRRHVTADEVYEYIKEEHPTIGKGTVYRNLNILAESGEIKKIGIPKGPDRYDFTLREHYHAVCSKCNNVFDVDMDPLPDLCDRIHDTHGMKYLQYEILFHGICPECL